MHSIDDEPITAGLELLGERWNLLLLREIFRGTRTFDALHRQLGIARPVLTDRLNRLVASGLLVKVAYREHPPRFEYRLSKSGREISPALVAIKAWSEQYFTQRSGVQLVHRRCGSPFEQAFWCPTCATTFGSSEVVSSQESRCDT